MFAPSLRSTHSDTSSSSSSGLWPGEEGRKAQVAKVLKRKEMFLWCHQRTSTPLLWAPLPTTPSTQSSTPHGEEESPSSAVHHLREKAECQWDSSTLPCPSYTSWCLQIKEQMKDQWLLSKQTVKMYFSNMVWWLAWFEKNCSWWVYLEILEFKLSISGLGVEDSIFYLYTITKISTFYKKSFKNV